MVEEGYEFINYIENYLGNSIQLKNQVTYIFNGQIHMKSNRITKYKKKKFNTIIRRKN